MQFKLNMDNVEGLLCEFDMDVNLYNYLYFLINTIGIKESCSITEQFSKKKTATMLIVNVE